MTGDEKRGGFTLLELLVVLIILGLLAALVGPRLIGKVGKAETEVAKSQIALLESALDQYRLDVGRYPTTEEGLGALINLPEDVGEKRKDLISRSIKSPKIPGEDLITIAHLENMVIMIYGPTGLMASLEGQEKTPILPIGIKL